MEKLNRIREGLIKSQETVATLASVKGQTIAAATSVVDRLGAITKNKDMIIFKESLSYHANIVSSLRKAEAIAGHLDRISKAKEIINKGPNANLNAFLEAMDQLEQTLQFFTSTPGGGETCVDVNLCLDNATTMVEEEFKNKLMALSKLVDPTSLIDESEVGAEQEVHFYTTMTLLPPLHNLARKLVLRGHKTECIDIYRDVRANALQQTLSHLGVEKIRSGTIETRVPKWIKLMEVSVLLFAGERNLCNQVLQGIEGSVLDQCFAQVTSSSLAMLLSFRDDFEKIVKSFEKLFVIVDIYNTMCNLKAEMEAIYASQASIMLGPMFDMMQWLANNITKTFLDFEQVVVGNTNTSQPMANEGIDPISICVMDFLNCSVNYEDILMRLLTEHKQESQEQDLRLSGPIEQIIRTLEKKLHEKSDYWNDLSQSYLFLVNNINYIVTSLEKTKAAKEILGEDWIQKQRGDVELFANNYKKASWKKVLDAIPSQGLVPSAEGSDNKNAAATKGIIKEMFENFNKQFEEQYQKQRHWVVDDSTLRQSLRISVSKYVNSAYRTFFEQFRPIVEKSKSNCIKYKPEELEMILLEGLFAEGKAPG